MSDILLFVINHLYNKKAIQSKYFINLIFIRVLHVDILKEKSFLQYNFISEIYTTLTVQQFSR